MINIAQAVSGPKLQNLIMQLRKICNHPYLFDVPNASVEADFDMHASLLKQKRNGSGCVKVPAVSLPDIVLSSGKMVLLERLLPELLARGHKVLIFSQMTKMLDILADWFEFIKGWSFYRIDGSVAISERKKQVCWNEGVLSTPSYKFVLYYFNRLMVLL